MRARNIKPGFFKNDALADLDPLARILFAGLWCLADCEGRVEDRPRIIKAELLPYDNVDVDALLTELSEADFVARYTAEETEVIQVVNFKRHQHTHPNEKPSELPAQRDIRKLPEITQPAPVMQQPNPASLLNPSSLNTESRVPEKEHLPSCSKEELASLNALKSVPDYPKPFDFSQELQFIRELAVDFPTVDMLEEVKAWKTYKIDMPLVKNKSRPHAQLRTWFGNAVKYQKEKSGNGNGHAPPSTLVRPETVARLRAMVAQGDNPEDLRSMCASEAEFAAVVA